MPFIVIKGRFRLLGKNKNGIATGFDPDGDSMQFQPDKPSLLKKLERLSSPVRLTSINSTQLRFEGIDALELHFPAPGAGNVTQPRPLADDARDHLISKSGLNPVNFKPPKNITVQPPAIHDGARGYILSRALEVHGRPVSFVFVGDPAERDGANVTLKSRLLRESLNFEMLRSGQSYPLFYDTLFADLRDELAQVSLKAKQNKLGLWSSDLTLTGVPAVSVPQLETSAVIFPKLFRRLTEFFGSGKKKMSEFLPFMEAKKERVFDLDTTNNTHFDTFIDVTGNHVKLKKSPDRLVFVSAKQKSPWM
jgi:endonuclease YncB( thermonuclease family)